MKTYSRKKLAVEHLEDVQSVCRLCLGKTEVMMPVYTGDVDVFVGIPMRIVTCLGLEVSRDDNLPKFICQLCKTELDRFYNFKKICTTNYWRLKTMLDGKKHLIKQNIVSEEKTMCSPTISTTSNNNLVQNQEECQLLVQVPNNLSWKGDGTITDRNVIVCNNKKESTCVPNSKLDQAISHGPTESTIHNQQKNNDPSVPRIEEAYSLNETAPDQFMGVEKDENEVEQENSGNTISTHLFSKSLVSALVESGSLARRPDGLEILNPNRITLNVEMGLGNNYVMELCEEDIEEAGPSRSENVNGNARDCATCGARLSSAGALRRHLLVHTGEKPHECDECGRRFAQREVLRRHRLLHTEKLPFQCAWCDKSYTQRSALGAHQRAHAPAGAPPPAQHPCPLCPKVFQHASGLSRHMNVHQGRAFACESCSRSFNDKSSLRRHERGHQRSRTS